MVTAIIRWTCDLCGNWVEQFPKTSGWDDITVVPPAGWNTMYPIPPEQREHPALDVCDACPQCAGVTK